ncbi:MAG: phosphate starvation-inducible protein PhoH, partial [Caulobacter sp. 35-67-4]
MTKRALKRMAREGATETGHYGDDAKVRRLPVDIRERGNSWSPLGPDGAAKGQERDQSYLKTIKPKSPGQAELMDA